MIHYQKSLIDTQLFLSNRHGRISSRGKIVTSSFVPSRRFRRTDRSGLKHSFFHVIVRLVSFRPLAVTLVDQVVRSQITHRRSSIARGSTVASRERVAPLRATVARFIAFVRHSSSASILVSIVIVRVNLSLSLSPPLFPLDFSVVFSFLNPLRRPRCCN